MIFLSLYDLGVTDRLVEAGVDVLVSGSGVFDGGNIAENVRRLKARLEQGG